MKVSIEPVPEFTPHELELVVAVWVEGFDAATCAARSCVPVGDVDADGEATELDAGAELVL